MWGKGKKILSSPFILVLLSVPFLVYMGVCPVFLLSKLPMGYLFFEFGKRFLFCYIFILVSPFCLKILIYQLGQFTLFIQLYSVAQTLSLL